MSDYAADIHVVVDASSAADARELLDTYLDHLFNESWVVELRCGVPRYVPVKGSRPAAEGSERAA